MSSPALGVLAGAAFGSALAISGVYLPEVIIGQMQLTSFRMLGVFLSASATSAIVFSIASWSHLAPKKVRAESKLGLFPFDGNVVGGAMIGAGMAIGGACPGTGLVQAALGLPSGPYVLLGGLLGAIAYRTVKTVGEPDNSATQASTKQRACHSGPDGQEQSLGPATISSSLGISDTAMLVLWEVLCLVSLAVIVKFSATTPWIVEPVTGGFLIGLSQIVNVALFKQPIGVSTAYEDVARWLEKLGTGSLDGKTIRDLATPSTAFAVGAMVGPFVLMHTGMVLPQAAYVEVGTGAGQAILSGVLLVFGARTAGGCTSGHGISGMAAFSVSSVATTVGIFASGILTASLTKVGESG